MNIVRLPVYLHISLLYALFGGAWILLSDRLLFTLVSNPIVLTDLQTYKGQGFVVLSAILIGLLTRHYLQLNQRAQHALRESEESYRQLFEHSIDAILLTAPDGSIYAANATACRFFQRTEAEMQQVGHNELVDMTDPRLQPALEERARTGNFSGNLRFLRSDGSAFEGELSTSLFINREGEPRTSMIIRDVTERKQLEEQLRDSEALFQRTVADAPFPMLLHAEDGQIIFVNQVWSKITGYSHHDIPTIADWSDRAYGERKEVVQADIDRLYSLETRVYEGEYVITTGNGQQRTWEFSSSPIGRAPDGRRLVLSMAADITERKQAEAALHQSNAQMLALARDLIEVEARERSNLARELHDRVGQSLTALNINLNITQRLLSVDSMQRIGPRINDSIQLVEETVNQVRNVMADLYPPVLTDYGLGAALRWYGEQFTRRTEIMVFVEERGEAGARLPAHLEAVLFRMAQESLNNIARHAQATKVAITFDSGTTVQLYISDNGNGFIPVTSTLSTPQKGWGLRTMRDRIEALGGTFHLETAPGQGTLIRAIVTAPAATV